MAGGNFIFGIVAYIQEFTRMNCVREAIYYNATENDFTNCLRDSGLFDNGTTWIFTQFILIIISVMIASIIDGKKKNEKNF